MFTILFAAVGCGGTPEPAFRADARSPRIERLSTDVRRGDTGAVARFWQEIEQRGAPMVEAMPADSAHVLLTFLYRATATLKNVTLDAQLATVRDDPSMVLTRLPNTDVWYKTYWIRSDMRFSYRLVPNPASGDGKDPLNAKSLGEGIGLGPSLIELAGAPSQPAIERLPEAPAGKITEVRVDSKILGLPRTASIYTPAGYDPQRAEPYPVLICFDGWIYTHPIPTPVILDNLIAQGKLTPTMAIFIDQAAQPQRNVELSNYAPFADFVAGELLPQLRRSWRITSNPAQTVVCGSSAGGLAAVYFSLHRPDVFGNVLAQSAALWPGRERDNPEHEWVIRQYAASPRLPVRFVLQPGVLEVVQTPLNGPSILDSNRRLRDVLASKGYEVHYSEAPGGHEPLAWRGGIAPGLIQLIGKGR